MKYCWLILGVSVLVGGTFPSCAANSATTSARQAPSTRVGQPRAALQNRLTDCVSLSFEDIVAARNVLLLPAQLTLTQSIGECGCMSSLLRYRVTVGGADSPLRSRDFVVDLNTRGRHLHEAEAMHLVLAPDAGRVASAQLLTVELTCTPAE